MRQTRLACFPHIIAATLLTITGCSEGGPEATYSVSGTVKLPDSTPLNGGQILFRPIKGKHSARGEIQEDGSFELSTFGSGDGAVAATHRVVITPPLPEDFMDEPAVQRRYRSPIDQRYQSVRTTTLEYAVTSDGPNHFDIVVEPPQP